VLAGLMPTYLAFALLAPVTGLTALTFITSANTYMQLHTDAGVRGRVMALYLMIFMGGTPVGAPIIGWIGEAYGARWTLLGGGMLTIAGVALSALVHLRLDRTRSARVATLETPAEQAPAAF
jgi:MFS family permease